MWLIVFLRPVVFEKIYLIVERVLERRIRTLVNSNERLFGFMPGKGTVDATLIVRKMQEEYQKKDKNLYMCFDEMENAFDRVPRKIMEWAMRKKGLSEVMNWAVMSLHDGAKTRVRVGSAYSEKFEVKVGVHQGSVLSPLLFAIVANVITQNARRGVVNELLYADDLVPMSDDMEDLKERFWNWKDTLESKDLKINTRKTKVMVSGSELFKSKIDPYGVCGKRVMANSVLHTICGNCVHWQICKNKESYR